MDPIVNIEKTAGGKYTILCELLKEESGGVHQFGMPYVFPDEELVTKNERVEEVFGDINRTINTLFHPEKLKEEYHLPTFWRWVRSWERVELVHGIPYLRSYTIWHNQLTNKYELSCKKKGPEYHTRIINKLRGSFLKASIASHKKEQKARSSLRNMLSKGQWHLYKNEHMISEYGKSGVTYIIRRGFPTIALRCKNNDGATLLCVLCLHPLGYYDQTHAGVLTPTDEVIAHLSMIRANEHYYWRKANQIPFHSYMSAV